MKTATGPKGSYGHQKDSLKKRLGRIEGQVRGISKMVDEEKYCVDILTQIAAVQAAMDRVTVGILEDHIRTCMAEATETGDAAAHLEELVGVLERFVALRR